MRGLGKSESLEVKKLESFLIYTLVFEPLLILPDQTCRCCFHRQLYFSLLALAGENTQQGQIFFEKPDESKV
ncbi:hypothetical protein [Pontibacter arcticus]|uniref:Uncharacterized protein n=1 Tax=Pontibacter arcticus TaxID=2080288 RepID=A0A364REZ2_9BACT|nr:hypothetical protein [Pontibacter arcticus]RAU82871.1 hypothetical protein DP923_06365 [Pontibacter arcticus]